jgi:phage gp29-like protein
MEIGTPNGLGLLLKAIPYVLYKRGCWGDWAQYSEVFGMPTKIGRYNGYDEATRIALESALDAAGSALSIVIPEEAKLEFLESKTTNGSADLYKGLADACDEQLSILFLGNTETTKSSKSSGYAQSVTHSHQQQQIAEDDRAYVLGYLETEVRRVMQSLGFAMDGGEWQFEAEQENISLKDRVNIDTTLKNAGLQIDDEYFYETYSIPKPKNYNKDKTEPPKPKEPTTPVDAKDKKQDLQNLDPTQAVTLTLNDLKDFFALATPTV